MRSQIGYHSNLKVNCTISELVDISFITAVSGGRTPGNRSLTVLNPKKKQARLLGLAGLINGPTHSSLKERSWLLDRGGGGRLKARHAVL